MKEFAWVAKALLVAATLSVASEGRASDMYRRVPVATPLTQAEIDVLRPTRVHDWNGFYAGAFAEYGLGHDGVGLRPGFDGVGSLNVGGFGGGIAAGYNYQNGNFVVGLEGDVLFSSMRDSIRGAVFGGSVADAKYDWLVTVRPRVGYAFDSLLLYATAGLAVGGIEYHVAATAPAGSMSVNSTRLGFAAGVGAEYAFTDRVSVKGEYLYTNLVSKTYDFAPNYHTKSVGVANRFRVGLNYRF